MLIIASPNYIISPASDYMTSLWYQLLNNVWWDCLGASPWTWKTQIKCKGTSVWDKCESLHALQHIMKAVTSETRQILIQTCLCPNSSACLLLKLERWEGRMFDPWPVKGPPKRPWECINHHSSRYHRQSAFLSLSVIGKMPYKCRPFIFSLVFISILLSRSAQM